ncbi:hypothetical protein A3Q56_06345 [Intoshia linei]|uniref:Superoxide dismutase n=1 Tax=Intoshia linei TaxID=1819745 RepID=A0A177AXL6_9BILA|nr:hypothetical protein A3Q56_06345 [Intoshia linei]
MSIISKNSLKLLNRNILKICGTAHLSNQTEIKKYTLPDLDYDFNALEPYISADIMRLHYEKHHATYVNNLNISLEKSLDCCAKNDIEGHIQHQKLIRFNGGGHINHSLFWKCLSPFGGGSPSGLLMNAIRDQFGDFQSFQSKFTASAIGVQGSGWCWLSVCPNSKTLHIMTTNNQDPLLASTGMIPILGVDVWEHAYYLQYQNRRPEYLTSIFNVIDWKCVNSKYETLVETQNNTTGKS